MAETAYTRTAIRQPSASKMPTASGSCSANSPRNNKGEASLHAARLRLRNRTLKGLAVAGFFESLASAEFRHAGGGDLDLGTGARIAADRGLALRHLEIAKADDPYGVSAAQGFLDVLERRVHGLLGRIL